MQLIDQGLLPRYLRRRRTKVFGEGRLTPLDREAKIRLMTKARALSRRTEKGKHYGVITAKAFDVLQALLFTFHNTKSGKCFPGYERIADGGGLRTLDRGRGDQRAGTGRAIVLGEPDYPFQRQGEGPVKGMDVRLAGDPQRKSPLNQVAS